MKEHAPSPYLKALATASQQSVGTIFAVLNQESIPVDKCEASEFNLANLEIAFSLAARNSNVGALQFLLRNAPRYKEILDQIIRAAINKLDFSIVNCVLDNTPPDNNHFDSALYYAAASGNTGEVRKIIAKHGANIPAYCFHRAVIAVAKYGHAPVIKEILAAGIVIPVSIWEDALNVAAKKFHSTVIHTIAVVQPDIEISNDVAFGFSIGRQRLDLMRDILAMPDEIDNSLLNKALVYFAKKAHLDLLDNVMARPNFKVDDKAWFTAFEYAAERRHVAVTDRLLQLPIAIETLNRAFMFAARYGYTALTNKILTRFNDAFGFAVKRHDAHAANAILQMQNVMITANWHSIFGSVLSNEDIAFVVKMLDEAVAPKLLHWIQSNEKLTEVVNAIIASDVNKSAYVYNILFEFAATFNGGVADKILKVAENCITTENLEFANFVTTSDKFKMSLNEVLRRRVIERGASNPTALDVTGAPISSAASVETMSHTPGTANTSGLSNSRSSMVSAIEAGRRVPPAASAGASSVTTFGGQESNVGDGRDSYVAALEAQRAAKAASPAHAGAGR